MRKTWMVAAAFAFALSGCGGGAAGDGERSAKSSNADEDEADDEGGKADSSEKRSIGKKSSDDSASSDSAGGWAIDRDECKATKKFGSDRLMIHQTSSAMNIAFVTDWVGDLGSDGTLEVADMEQEASMITESGDDWVMVSTPNDEPGGLHDIVANSSSIKFAWKVDGDTVHSKTFSLQGTNAAMDQLRKCAGL